MCACPSTAAISSVADLHALSVPAPASQDNEKIRTRETIENLPLIAQDAIDVFVPATASLPGFSEPA